MKAIIMITLSTLSFALSSVFAKYVHLWEPTSALEVTFYRFAIGFICTLGYVTAKRRSLVPKNTIMVVLRALTNTAGVILFYFGVAYTTVSKATLLNMTYPAFVLIAAPFINREKFVRSNLFWLFIIFIGMYLIISPDFSSIQFGDIISLGSGVAMALSVTFLREAGKSNDRYIILFYLMSIGLVINTVFALPLLSLPGWGKGTLLFLSGLTGFLGQYFATTGFMHIEAAMGSLVSVSRIVFSVALGVMLFDDPLTLKIVSGGLLIVISLAWMSGFFKKRPARAVL